MGLLLEDKHTHLHCKKLGRTNSNDNEVLMTSHPLLRWCHNAQCNTKPHYHNWIWENTICLHWVLAAINV